ncbi:hypothetical protein ACQ86G_21455 [Roseateles chitinivorans]|uniref:hypothetical protein n=1 Tax=Roseateles chitinivorans TaxID=2917965 RepID=UPI003D66D36F
MGRHYTEDGPEDTGAYVGGVACSGHNGSLHPYRHPQRTPSLMTPEQRAAWNEVRSRLLVRAKATELQQLRG